MKKLALLALIVLSLSACAPAAGGTAEQIATAVSATLEASGQPAPTAEPTLGEIATQAPASAACANSGLLSVAYVKSGNIWLWVQGGMLAQLTTSADAGTVVLSDDGCRIAYTRSMPNPRFDPSLEFPTQERLNELWVVNSDGTNNHVLVDTDFLAAQPVPQADYILSVFDLAFQPATYQLAFNTQVLHPGLGLSLNQDLFMVDVDTSSLSQLLSAGQAGGLFTFSPDGSQIALSAPTSIHVVNADGTDLRSDLVTFPQISTYSEYAYTPPVTWAPGGASFMVAVPPADPLAPPSAGLFPETALWWLPLDGTPAFQAGGVQAAFFILGEVAFAPDAGRIAYLRPLDTDNHYELVTALSNGSNESPTVTAANIRFVAWAPDSTRYLYSYEDGGLHLILANAIDPNVQPISTLNDFAASQLRARWVSADQFVLLETGAAGAQLSLLDVNGAGEVIDVLADPFVAFNIAN